MSTPRNRSPQKLRTDFIDDRGQLRRLDSEDPHLLDANDYQHLVIRYFVAVGHGIALVVGAGLIGMGLAKLSEWIGSFL